MTSRLYYQDPECRRFEAEVMRVTEIDGRPAVVLDRSAFYPTSGGQPADRGRLGAAAVLDVVDEGDDVLHVLDVPLTAGSRLEGEIDWVRRFDHMQQHTGQHILSAAFERLHGNRTVSFHMGADVSTIDLAQEASPAAIEAAVDAANAVVWDDRPVTIRFADAAEASTMGLRKASQRQGELRLIEIEGCDLSACGGTHVARTGGVGVIVAASAERWKGGTRLSFACGGRAVRSYRVLRDAVAGSVRALSVLPAELPDAVQRAMAEAKDLRKVLQRQQAALAVHEGARLAASAAPVGRGRLVCDVLDGWDVNGLKAVALAAVSSDPALAIALVSSSRPSSVVVARGNGLAIDAGSIVRDLMAEFGGRGGGKADLAQGGGCAGEPAAVAASARARLDSALA